MVRGQRVSGEGTGASAWGFACWSKLAQNFGAAKGNEVPQKNELKHRGGCGNTDGDVLYKFIKKYIQICVYTHRYMGRGISQQVTILISPPVVFIVCDKVCSTFKGSGVHTGVTGQGSCSDPTSDIEIFSSMKIYTFLSLSVK